MKKFSELQILEASSKVSKIIGGLFRFQPDISDEEIIDTVLRDFTTKLASIIRDTYNPEISLSSLYTYDLFFQKFAVDNGGDVSTERIYQEIPSETCYSLLVEMFPELEINKETFTGMFDGGEFPLVSIWKGYHEGRNEIHVTYSISR